MDFEGQAVWSVTSKHAVFQPHATEAADGSVCSPCPGPAERTGRTLSAPAHHLTGSATYWSSQELSDETLGLQEFQ